MSRVACVFALLASLAASARADDLPPGAVARLGDDRFRAGGRIDHLALSPDGKQFATARPSHAGVTILSVWDATTGRPVREQRVNTELFQGFAWGRGGALAVATRAEIGPQGESGRVYPDDFCVWDLSDPKAEAPPMLGVDSGGLLADRPRGAPTYGGFVFSADGKRVAASWTGAGKHAVHVFELKAAKTAAKLARVGAIDLGAEGVDGVRLSADGRTVVTFRLLAGGGVPEWTATVWDADTGKPSKPVHVPRTEYLRLTPGARSLVLFAREEDEWGFDLFDLTTGKRRPLGRWRYTAAQLDASQRTGFALPPAFAYSFTPGDRELLAAVGGKTFAIDLKTGKELGRLEGHADTPTEVAVSADGTTIATADIYGLVRLWDANTLRALHDAPGHGAPVSHAELSPDGKRLLTWAPDATVRLWDVTTGKELRAFAGAHAPGGDDLGRPTFTPDGTAVLYGTKDRLVARDLQTGLETPLPGEMAKLGPRLAAFAPDGKAVLTWAGEAGSLHGGEVWDWPGGKKRFTFPRGEHWEVVDPCFSPDSCAVLLDSSSPRRWDSQTGKELPPAWRDDRATRVSPLASLRPNPRWLLYRPEYGDPRVIEAGTARDVPRFRLARGKDGDASLAEALSPRPAQFACSFGVEPAEVLLCESATGQVRRELRGHRGDVRVLGFTPDGTKLLTAGGDHTLLVWDVRLQSVPLPEAVKQETSAAKLWNTLATGSAKDAYLAMARLARDPDAALKMAAMKLKPAAKGERDTDATRLADARAIELLESLDTDAARDLLKELAGGDADAFRTREAKRALERNAR